MTRAFLLVFFFTITSSLHAQVNVSLSHGFDIIKNKHITYSQLKRAAGRPSEIEQGMMDQPLCSRSRGRSVQFVYQKYDLKAKSWKQVISGSDNFKRMVFAPWYYKECYVSSYKIGPSSSLLINDSLKISGITIEKLHGTLGKPQHLTRDKETVHTYLDTASNYAFIFSFDQSQKFTGLLVARVYEPGIIIDN